MREKVTVRSVEFDIPFVNKEGKTNEAAVIAYRTDAKVLKEARAYSAFLAKNVVLSNTLRSLKAGDVITIDTELFGKMISVKDVFVEGSDVPPERVAGSPSKGGSTGSPTKVSTFDSTGAQVGNALTTAASVLASSGKAYTVASLGKTAREVLVLGNTLKAELSSGKLTTDDTSSFDD